MIKTIRVARRDVDNRREARRAKTIKSDEYFRAIQEVRKPLASRSFYQRNGVQL